MWNLIKSFLLGPFNEKSQDMKVHFQHISPKYWKIAEETSWVHKCFLKIFSSIFQPNHPDYIKYITMIQ